MRPTRRSQQGSHYDLMVPLLWIHEMPGLGARHYSPRTAEAYRVWVKRFVYLHGLRHPTEMGGPEINTFLTPPAVADKVSASTQNQALSALLFLYRHVLHRLTGDKWLIVSLLYGSDACWRSLAATMSVAQLTDGRAFLYCLGID